MVERDQQVYPLVPEDRQFRRSDENIEDSGPLYLIMCSSERRGSS